MSAGPLEETKWELARRADPDLSDREYWDRFNLYVEEKKEIEAMDHLTGKGGLDHHSAHKLYRIVFEEVQREEYPSF